jgi:hypothetical protein
MTTCSFKFQSDEDRTSLDLVVYLGPTRRFKANIWGWPDKADIVDL